MREAHKDRLQAATQRELAEHKAQLERLNKQQEIRFGVLQAKRAEYLAEVYGVIQDAHDLSIVLARQLQNERLEDQEKRGAYTFEAVQTELSETLRRRRER